MKTATNDEELAFKQCPGFFSGLGFRGLGFRDLGVFGLWSSDQGCVRKPSTVVGLPETTNPKPLYYKP